ncbi:MAG: bifunctional phosphopantothenoylcysteine decarboxylase/phosphopantothenate--cysteine ligase CoaBC [Mariprofundaceae bacterium]|nr:bifunctional phosphopantothenoylcysteine decarboxylase/phosphopantothenate--cysteine ligase CoaBC [Mariprofundaceae bacterium]
MVQLDTAPWAERRVVLGVGGGIAAYRAAETARLLIHQGINVHVVMTAAAQQFVTPLTFEALTGNPVHHQTFAGGDRTMTHISLVRQADLLLVAPCTANLMAKFNHGIADDLLTTMYAAKADIPVLLAPAMNPAMWQHAATQRNQQQLQNDGVQIVAPQEGSTACGEHGVGRMASPEALLFAVQAALTPSILHGQHWVINAGPTAEPWDAVRVLTNRASGQLGCLMAEQAVRLGAQVTLIAGPGVRACHPSIQRINSDDAASMLQACIAAAAGCDVFVATAAVSDYRFAEQHSHKLKRQGADSVDIRLLNNPDIVAHIATMAARPGRVIAFAAESEAHCTHARSKLEKKAVDAIIANDVSHMGVDSASGWWLTRNHAEVIPAGDKSTFSLCIISHILELNCD